MDARSFEIRQQELVDVMDALTRDIDAGRLANIVLLVPPGGLPEGFDQKLKSLADGLASNTSVRLDILLVRHGRDPAPPPGPLGPIGRLHPDDLRRRRGRRRLPADRQLQDAGELGRHPRARADQDRGGRPQAIALQSARLHEEGPVALRAVRGDPGSAEPHEGRPGRPISPSGSRSSPSTATAVPRWS